MKRLRRTVIAALLLATCSATFATGALAQERGNQPMHEHDGPGFHGGPPEGLDGPGLGLAHLRGLQLTEAQQDKLFAIHHAQAPQRREQDKAIRKAHDTLRELATADRFDEARATAASREFGQAVAAQALARARMEAQVLAVLTPEQRAALRDRHAHGGGRHEGGPGGGGRPGRP